MSRLEDDSLERSGSGGAGGAIYMIGEHRKEVGKVAGR